MPPIGPPGPSFAAAFLRTAEGWAGAEVELAAVEILDDLGDTVEEALGLVGDELALLCVEVEDEWFALLRYQGAAEPRIFLSDAQAVGASGLGELLAESAGFLPDAEAHHLGVQPVGDAGLLTDLGLPAPELLELSAAEGALPAETLSAIAEKLGFADELDRLR